jgi:hypothetical protein
MNFKTPALLLTLACAGLMNQAHADCAADATIADTQRAYAKAQQFEREGNKAAAFANYVAAQEATCEANPVETAAAKRAAALALTLGAAVERQGNFERAFEIYDSGGQYTAADRVLMAWVRSQPDSRSVFEKARQELDYRALPAFQSNNAVRLSVTAAYHPNPLHLAEVLAMPGIGAQRALQKEMAAFNEQYLRDYMRLIQTRPDDLTDGDAMESFMNAQQEFSRTHTYEDPIKASRDALEQVQSWEAATFDQAVAARIRALRQQRLEQRIVLLTKSFAGAPQFLEAAKDYQRALRLDEGATKARLASIKAQAARLGDEATDKGRYTLAAEYYEVAEDEAKAAAVREAQQKLAMNKMQPSIDQMKKQAEEMQQQFGDPAKVQAMREQALAMQKSLQQQRQTNAGNKAKSAAELEKELGI